MKAQSYPLRSRIQKVAGKIVPYQTYTFLETSHLTKEENLKSKIFDRDLFVKYTVKVSRIQGNKIFQKNQNERHLF